MNAFKFYKITKEAMKLFLNNSLNEESLTNIINKIHFEKEFKNEDIYEETQLIKYLFSIKKYYEIEEFCDKFIIFLFNMPCISKKTQADISLIIQTLEKLNGKIKFRIYSQVDIHIYSLLKLNYMEGLNNNVSIILENSSYMDDAIGIDLAESFTYEQYSFFDNSDDKSDKPREILSKNNEEIKCSIQASINSLISKYYNDTILNNFIALFNTLFKNIKLEEQNKRIIAYLFNLKMKYYLKQARKNWQNKKSNAKKDIKSYTLPLNFK